MVEVRGGGDIPGAASQRKRLEAAHITGEVGDDHLHDFVWEIRGRFVRGVCRFVRSVCPWRRIVEEAVDLGFASIPNDDHTS